jgi:hypothetical protein
MKRNIVLLKLNIVNYYVFLFCDIVCEIRIMLFKICHGFEMSIHTFMIYVKINFSLALNFVPTFMYGLHVLVDHTSKGCLMN